MRMETWKRSDDPNIRVNQRYKKCQDSQISPSLHNTCKLWEVVRYQLISLLEERYNIYLYFSFQVLFDQQVPRILFKQSFHIIV